MAHVSELSGEGAAGYFEEVLDAPVRDEDAPATNLYHRYVKRTLDIVILLLTAPFVLPLVLVLARLVRRDGGPAFYCQDRIGLNGHSFRLWKLRSMVPDADRLLEAHLESNPQARAEWDHAQKLKDDPRITPIGRFIRKASLDELPQLWNVLIGDMSLVGPRPMMPSQTPLYPGRAYYALRPGLTGFWQISSRNQTSFAARAAFDARYARQLSLGTDLVVLLATVRVVLRGTGY
jgi:exopolysaccharide production protein ExoY